MLRTLILSLTTSLACMGWAGAANAPVSAPRPIDGGIEFSCSAPDLARLQREMPQYLSSMGVAAEWVDTTPSAHGMRYQLRSVPGDTNTLALGEDPQYQIHPATIRLPDGAGRWRAVQTVSKKEILLAMLHPGRTTTFEGRACSAVALAEQIGLRQNIAAWAQKLSWNWPDGESAQWAARYWDHGTPRRLDRMRAAFADAFEHQERYAIGCYTASKLVEIQAVLDYYGRVQPNKAKLAKIEARLASDSDPLVNVEPPVMWRFEPDHDAGDDAVAGKLVTLIQHVPADNFIPGDWAYIVNTDTDSALKVGYEGSNAIYLGRGQFDDFFDDNHHAYTFRQKLDEVYQWRNGVFSRSRDRAKRQKLGDADYRRLASPPEVGGLLLDVRAVPYVWGEP